MLGANLRAVRTLPFSPSETAESGPETTPHAERRRWPFFLTLGLVLLIFAAGLWVRLRNNGYGLPYVYNYHEAQHFTNRAVNMFGGSFDPRYYQNPTGYTYLLYVAM